MPHQHWHVKKTRMISGILHPSGPACGTNPAPFAAKSNNQIVIAGRTVHSNKPFTQNPTLNKQYPDLIYLIRETLKYTHFYYTRKIAPDNGDYKLPEYLKSKYPKAITKKVAFYSYLNNDFGYGVTISSRAWNQTGENSKAGIILQEVLRQIQIAYKDNMSDGTLEKFTAMIMLSDPEDCRIENLEFGNFMSDIVQYPDNELRRQLIGLCKKFEDKYEYLDECYIRSDIALNDFSKVANRVTALIPEYLDSSYMSIRDEFVSLYLKGMKASLRKTHPSWYDLKQHY